MRSRLVVFGILWLTALSLCALAQTSPAPATAPAAAPSSQPATPSVASAGSRILHSFDFEETALGNFESTPMFWRKVVGPGFPAYASGRFDHDVFRSEHTSFRLDIDSGSAAYRFVAPLERRIPINSNADYYILGFAKTTPL